MLAQNCCVTRVRVTTSDHPAGCCWYKHRSVGTAANCMLRVANSHHMHSSHQQWHCCQSACRFGVEPRNQRLVAAAAACIAGTGHLLGSLCPDRLPAIGMQSVPTPLQEPAAGSNQQHPTQHHSGTHAGSEGHVSFAGPASDCIGLALHFCWLCLQHVATQKDGTKSNVEAWMSQKLQLLSRLSSLTAVSMPERL